MNFPVAFLQIAPLGNDQNRNLEKGAKAKAVGADLAVFPELWNIGCDPCPIDFRARQAWMNPPHQSAEQFFPGLRRTHLSSCILFALAHSQAQPTDFVFTFVN